MARTISDHAPVPARRQDGVLGPGLRWLTLGLLGSVGIVAFDGLGVATALPAISADLGGLSTYGWAVSALMLAGVIGTVLAGHAADRYGPARPFAVGTIVFCAGVVASALAPSWTVFLAGRAVQGLGVGAVMSMAYVAVASAYPEHLRGRALALTSAAWAIPALAGPSLSGALTVTIGWRALFAVLAPVTAVIGALAWRQMVLVERVTRATGDDSPGTRTAVVRTAVFSVLLAVGAGMLLAGLERHDAVTLILLVVPGAVLAAASLRAVTPAGTLTARRGVPAGLGARAMICAAFFGIETFFPLAMTQLRGTGLTEAGIGLSAGALLWVIGSWWQGRRDARRAGAGRTLDTLVGLTLLALGIAVVAATTLSTTLPTLMAALGWGLGGLGMGLAYNAVTTETFGRSAPSAYGATSGSLQMVQTLFTAGAAGVGTAIVSASVAGDGLRTGMGWVFVMALAAALAAVPLALRIRDRTPRR